MTALAAATALSGPAEGHRIEQTGLCSLFSGALLEHETDGRFIHSAASRKGTNEFVGGDHGRSGEEPVHDLLQFCASRRADGRSVKRQRADATMVSVGARRAPRPRRQFVDALRRTGVEATGSAAAALGLSLRSEVIRGNRTAGRSALRCMRFAPVGVEGLSRPPLLGGDYRPSVRGSSRGTHLRRSRSDFTVAPPKSC